MQGPRFVDTGSATAAPVSTFGARFDAVLDALRSADARIATIEAERARLLAEAASLSESAARTEGAFERSVGSAGSEWWWRRLCAEIACSTRRTERAVACLINDSVYLVDKLPGTLLALESGTLSYQHARVMIGQTTGIPEPGLLALERQLLPSAAHLPARRFEERARRLRERLHPESIEVRTVVARDERFVQLSPECDGMATLTHYLPAVDALAIDDLIDRTARALREGGDTRTQSQRRSDVLTDLVLGGREHPASATVMVTVPAATIAGGSEPGDLHGYGPIDPHTARKIAATAPTFLRALLRPGSAEPVLITRHHARPVADGAGPGRYRSETGRVDRTGYAPSPVIRTALRLLDETCRFPGCGRRAARCELDHVRAWEQGGETTPENLAHLCSSHHHLKHEGGWVVRTGPGRSLHWTSPRGHRYTTHPPNAPPESE